MVLEFRLASCVSASGFLYAIQVMTPKHRGVRDIPSLRRQLFFMFGFVLLGIGGQWCSTVDFIWSAKMSNNEDACCLRSLEAVFKRAASWSL